MEGDAAAQAPPRPTNVREGLGLGPLLEGIFPDLEQGGAATLPFLAHDMHAPLVLVAGATAAGHGLYDLDLFAVLFDQAADVDDALEAGVG
jgi:hypothetical protein